MLHINNPIVPLHFQVYSGKTFLIQIGKFHRFPLRSDWNESEFDWIQFALEEFCLLSSLIQNQLVLHGPDAPPDVPARGTWVQVLGSA